MKKIIFVLLLVIASLSAQMLNIDDFSSEVFSKVTKKPVTIKIKMMIEGRYVEEESYKIIDALNIVIGSFYLEDLVTSQGKIKLKESIKSYTTSKYSIDIDNIYTKNSISTKYTRDYRCFEKRRNVRKITV